MPTRAIQCLYCGTEGEREVRGLNRGIAPARLFRHRGHNPFSGHMHYQCPACKIILLVDPMAVLADDDAVAFVSRGRLQRAAGPGHIAATPG